MSLSIAIARVFRLHQVTMRFRPKKRGGEAVDVAMRFQTNCTVKPHRITAAWDQKDNDRTRVNVQLQDITSARPVGAARTRRDLPVENN